MLLQVVISKYKIKCNLNSLKISKNFCLLLGIISYDKNDQDDQKDQNDQK